MELDSKHILQWYQDNIQLVRKVCWKASKRSDCGKNITLDDLMAHCLDKIQTVFFNYSPDKGTKLSTFVHLSLRFECMKYIEKRNKTDKRFRPYFNKSTKNVVEEHFYNENVQYIEQDDLADVIFSELEKMLSPIELRIYLLHAEGMSFEQIALTINLGPNKVKAVYWGCFYKIREVISKKHLQNYVSK